MINDDDACFQVLARLPPECPLLGNSVTSILVDLADLPK